MMKRTIIYVFGPKRLASKYYSNSIMNLEEGGWLKIGQKEENNEEIDKWDSAVLRVNQETRTGIPEICQIYDVFEYPYMSGNVDDEIRRILTNDIYELENSKSHNRNVEKYEIKAGREFVYGVTRSQLLNAIAKFERNLIIENYKSEEFETLMSLILRNNESDEVALEPNVNNDSSDVSSSKNEWGDNLWKKIIDRLKNNIRGNISNPPGRPYMFFKSSTSELFSYSIGYSVRYGITSVGIETFGGEDAKNTIEDIISKNNISIPNLVCKQGAKNKNKWAWSVNSSLDKSDDELIEWYVETILMFYKHFEPRQY